MAIELSEATAALCRERVGERAEVMVGNIETGEGMEGREFDAIVGVSVLHHLNLDACFDRTFPKLPPAAGSPSPSRTWRTPRSGQSATSTG